MKLHIRAPLEGMSPIQAFRRWRDGAPALRLPHVRALRERHRDHDGHKVRRLLEWALDVELPLVARPFLSPEALILELDETWDESCLACTWKLRSRGLPEGAAGACGTLDFADGELSVQGTVELDLAQVPAVPGPLARSVGPALEQSIARAIERAYGSLAAALLRQGL